MLCWSTRAHIEALGIIAQLTYLQYDLLLDPEAVPPSVVLRGACDRGVQFILRSSSGFSTHKDGEVAGEIAMESLLSLIEVSARDSSSLFLVM